MKIGTFTKTDQGTFTGSIQTLTLDQKIELVPLDDKPNSKSPDFQIFRTSTHAEIGAGWNKTSKSSGNPYINIKIDDPAFNAALWCALTKTDEGDYALYWTRSEGVASNPSVSEPETL